TAAGGNETQSMVNRAALDIAAGRAYVVLLTGGEAWRTRTAVRRAGARPDWTIEPEDAAPDLKVGDDRPLSHPNELARGAVMPITWYPLFDNALRAADGLTIDEHRDRIAGLWSRFSEVAATNPHAWIQQRYSPDELRTPSADNRMVGFPYTKRMNSNAAVEQSAAVIVCSVERARALGVPADRWVFPWSGTDAHDHWLVSNRADLASSPAIRLAGRTCLDLAGIDVDDLAHVDLYSCFPSAVQIAARELGLALDRQLTVTGGLSFAGGPWNNYVMHSIATMTGVLREDPAAIGLCTANGGWITKHAFGVYSSRPPATPFRHHDAQAEVDALPCRELVEEHDGAVTVESSTVMHDRSGEPETACLALLLADGRRAWGTSEDASLMDELMTEETAGRPGHLAPDGVFHLS
ncbi:MAG: acetyl-CoA acetyltransferase, partial [Acidimicrobiales bacterium]|nr:acetyl-CoA acetyltransferase [Acidimicrobiales bacterium]